MTVQASKAPDPVKPAAPAQRAPGRRQPDAADSGFAQLLKGQTSASRPEQTAKSDEPSPGDKDNATRDKSRADEAKKAEEGNPSPSPAPSATTPDDVAGQPNWFQTLLAQREANADASAGSDALAALRDAAGAHSKAERASSRADAALAGADKGLAADKTRGQAVRLGAADLGDTGLSGQNTARPEPVADLAAAPGDGSLPSLSGLLSAPASPVQQPGLAAANAAAASTAATLPMPPDHPAFPQALGVQLSTWLRDGVEHARLELHPQDLGPIDVRIAVSGGQTRVDLNADVAATRIALAQAIPQLAQVLGDVGLALSGSSVSAQTGQGDPGASGSDASSSGRQADGRGRHGVGGVGGLGGPDGAGANTKRVHRQGLLDLYA